MRATAVANIVFAQQRHSINHRLVLVKELAPITGRKGCRLELLFRPNRFSEATLRRAYGRARNADIAAHIIGFVRQAAIGEPLVAYETRVDNAVARLLARGTWTDKQRDWLRRIGLALKQVPIGDRDTLDGPAMRQRGGFAAANRAFDGRLGEVLGDLNEAIWARAAA